MSGRSRARTSSNASTPRAIAWAAHGVSAYAVDVTSPDVQSAGFHVVRVIAPELCQLDVIERARFLGGFRLYEAAYEAGLVERPMTLADLNPDPHPFP